MNITLKKVAYEEKSILRQLMELYAYDFSEFMEDMELGPHGYFGYRYFDHYWTEQDRHPYFIYADDKLAGFVLVNTFCSYIKEGHSIGEFFVMRRYRRGGIGKRAAYLAFDAHPGMWEVNQVASNIVAAKFWERVIAEYTGGNYGIHVVMMGDEPGGGQNFHTDNKAI